MIMTSRPPKEKAVFTAHYAQLTSALVNIDGLLPHFVSSGIIKDEDEEYIKAAPTNSDRVGRLLKYISGPLQAGFTTSYYEMLDIIYHHGNDAARALAVKMGRKEEISSAISTNLTASDQQQQSSSINSNSGVYTPTLAAIGNANSEGGKKTMYPKICRATPPCAIIINNVKFKRLRERSWSISDKEKIVSLGAAFGIKFSEYTDLKMHEMQQVLSQASGSLSQDNNNGLLVFIMTHGTTDDRLYGSDENLIPLKQLVEMFESDKCPLLEDKPKIFIIHACRGGDPDPTDRPGSMANESYSEGLPPSDVTPRKADFLFIHSTTDGCLAYGHEDKGFIPILVETLKKRFNDSHLEDLLLDVKKQVAATAYREKGEHFKQMPSVVSQMRDRVWFAKY